MITPRTTRLVRVADLTHYRAVLMTLACEGEPLDARDRVVVVPTRAAGALLRRGIEKAHLADGRALLLPDLIVPRELPLAFAQRAAVSAVEARPDVREVLMGVAARAAAEGGQTPPFQVRPGLLAEMVRFYDGLRERTQSVEAFERLAVGRLAPGAEYDRGAARQLRQTHFLVAAFRAFEQLCEAHQLRDAHGLRQLAVATPATRPWRHVIVAVGDQVRDPYGLCVADWDLLARVPGLASLDIVTTDRTLAGAWHERVHQLLPGIEEVHVGDEPAPAPTLRVRREAPEARRATPTPLRRAWDVRDREEEVADFARWARALVRSGRTTEIERIALVVRQPLPYVYLAREVLRSAAVPHQTFDAVPLAAEPYAAALDLVITAAGANLSRAALVALLASPHLQFVDGESPVSRGSLSAADRVLSERGYLGGLAVLERLVDRIQAEEPGPGRAQRALPALRAMVSAGRSLEPLRMDQPADVHLECLLRFMAAHEARVRGDDDTQARSLRARAAVRGILSSLLDAYRSFDQTPVSSEHVVAMIRRAIETHTFAPRVGIGGVHIVDAESARFGDFAFVQVAGLVDREWPERARRNVFYGPSILRDLGWSSETELVDHARASFADLLRLAAEQVTVTTFGLEDDAIVTPSTLLDELEMAALDVVEEERPTLRIFADECLARLPRAVEALEPPVQAAALRRLRKASRTEARFHGATSGHTASSYSLSALERYQKCPFQFFANSVLRLEELPEDEPFLSPRARGRFIHEVFQRFFEAWDARGAHTITADNLSDARALFAEVAAPLLATLGESDAALERARLFGSAVAMGIVDVVLGLEASMPARVVERWLERSFEGEYALGGEDGRRIRLKGIADRVDLLEGHALRVIDYKTGVAPAPGRALQVPIYALCAQEQASARDGQPWTVAEAAYVAFSGRRALVPIVESSDDAGPILAEARARLFEVVDAVTRGSFPPRPHEITDCRYCAFPSVCRKDYVDE